MRSIAIIAALFVMHGCGDNLAVVDAGGIALDVRGLTDALVPVACADDDDCPGATCNLDAGLCFACLEDTDCDGLFATLCLSDGRCAECRVDVDCGSAALGPTCQSDLGYCTCSSDSDCTGNSSGPLCRRDTATCGCYFDDDCPQGSECKLEPYLGIGVRRCQSS